MLKEFTDILAHDLRNPLNAIDQYLTLYEESGERTHIESIDQTTDRMARLVDDLLRVAKQGDVVTDPEPTDIETVEDDGPGISDSVGAEVFDHGVTTARDGSGYGLSIVRTIVNAHGWDISLATAESGGARFEITGIEFLD
jgi:signal transduction histidine kinase